MRAIAVNFLILYRTHVERRLLVNYIFRAIPENYSGDVARRVHAYRTRYGYKATETSPNPGPSARV